MSQEHSHKQELLLEHTENVHALTEWLQQTFGGPAKVLFVTGSAGPLSLGNLFSKKDLKKDFLPMHARTPVVKGHTPEVVVGDCNGTRVCWFAGRVHLNEDPQDIYATSVVVRAAIKWGVKYVFLTNAVGAVNQTYSVGDIVIVGDHIDLFSGTGPLTGDPETMDTLGPRFLDCEEVYSTDLAELATQVHERSRSVLNLQRDAVFAMLPGPHFETPAVVRALHALGVDTVGMSLVHEALSAHHMGVPVLAISVVTNMSIHRRRSHAERSDLTHEGNMVVVRQKDGDLANYLGDIFQAMAGGIDSVIPAYRGVEA